MLKVFFLFLCRTMPGAEMQDRLGLIEMKLDAIMAYLGIKNPYPAGSAPQGKKSMVHRYFGAASSSSH